MNLTRLDVQKHYCRCLSVLDNETLKYRRFAFVHRSKIDQDFWGGIISSSFFLFNRFDRITMDQLTARKLLQRPRGSGAGAPTNGNKSNNLSPWNSPVMPQRALNSSVQFLTSAGTSPNLERRSVNEGTLTCAKFTLIDDDDDDDVGGVARNGNGEPARKKAIKSPRRPRSLSEDRRNSCDFEHVALLSPAEIRIRASDGESDPFKMETAIV